MQGYHTCAEMAWVTVYSVSVLNCLHKDLHWTGVINVLEDGICSRKTKSGYKTCFMVKKRPLASAHANRGRDLKQWLILWRQYVVIMSIMQFPINLSKRCICRYPTYILGTSIADTFVAIYLCVHYLWDPQSQVPPPCSGNAELGKFVDQINSIKTEN